MLLHTGRPRNGSFLKVYNFRMCWSIWQNAQYISWRNIGVSNFII